MHHDIHAALTDFYPRSPCGERRYRPASWSDFRDFYPRSPCGERPYYPKTAALPFMISIHALLAESDLLAPQGGAPGPRISIHALLAESDLAEFFCVVYVLYISIHALLAESDLQAPPLFYDNNDFYPRSPCGERRNGQEVAAQCVEFLSTLSLRRATSYCRYGPQGLHNFYPRSPCGERPLATQIPNVPQRFLSTLSLRRATKETTTSSVK